MHRPLMLPVLGAVALTGYSGDGGSTPAPSSTPAPTNRAPAFTSAATASSSYERRNQDFAPGAGTINQLASFGEDAAGNLFIVDLDGEIFMVTPG